MPPTPEDFVYGGFWSPPECNIREPYIIHALCRARRKDLPEIELTYQLWYMLLRRCPNLEELSLLLFYSSYRLADLEKLTMGVFPYLHSLHLDISCHSNGTDPTPSQLALGPLLEMSNATVQDMPSLRSGPGHTCVFRTDL
ncbi:hypothetical protein C8J57DRAFT_1494135 [Mycena rebaudengoi]|nr:hypothetical protein C8J57DRAFT_1494135 [Mycena rebaudengoi]